MKKTIFSLLLLLPFALHAQTPTSTVYTGQTRDSVVMQSMLYFNPNVYNDIPPSQYYKMAKFLNSIKKYNDTKIRIIGWTDKRGTEELNNEFSLKRAESMKKYLVRQGIAIERITTQGKGIDTQAASEDNARRVDMIQVIELVLADTPVQTPPAAEKQQEPQEQPQQIEVVQTQQPEREQEQQPVQEQHSVPVQEQNPNIAPEVVPTVRTNSNPWYVGVKGGVPFGVSTLSSFGDDKTRIGYNFGALAGYRFNHIFSTEVSAMFGNMELGASKCCADYWLGDDGLRYVSPVAGAKGDYYRNLYSNMSMQQYSLQLNVDMVQLIKRNDVTRWSVLISPSIYGVSSQSTLRTIGTKRRIFKANKQFQFGAGGEIGVGCRLTNNLGLRLSSGIDWIVGDNYDGVLGDYHSENFVWNNNLSLTWRFNKR